MEIKINNLYIKPTKKNTIRVKIERIQRIK